MNMMRRFPVWLLLSSVAVLPACSMGGGQGSAPAAYTLAQPAGVSAATIQQVQMKLREEGDYSQAIDGVWGPSTVAGVQAYQQRHGLAVTGQLDGPTMAAMNDTAPPPPMAAAPTQPMATQPMATPPDVSAQPVTPKTP